MSRNLIAPLLLVMATVLFTVAITHLFLQPITTDISQTMEYVERVFDRLYLRIDYEKRSRAIMQMHDIALWVEMEYLDKGRYPTDIPLLKDPWGNPYIYYRVTDNILQQYIIRSAGEDGLHGTDRDIRYDQNGVILGKEDTNEGSS